MTTVTLPTPSLASERRLSYAEPVALLALTGVLALWSIRFAGDGGFTHHDLVGFVVTYVAAGGVYLLAALRLLRSAATPWLLLVGIGAAMRLAMLASTPVLEVDYYRYLWDGAVSTRWVNPYVHSPQEVIAALDGQAPLPPALVSEAKEAESILRRIDHPRLTSVYPPVAQAFFAVAHLIAPRNLLAWRFVLLALDALTFLVIVALLRQTQRPIAWSALYWWNPLVVKEILNSGHMDVIALPLVLCAVLAALRRRRIWLAVALAVAVAAKVWPVILLPILMRQACSRRRQAVAGTVAFCVMSLALWSPVLLAGFDRHSGFVAYSRAWQNNDAVFGGVVFVLHGMLNALPLHIVSAQALARGLLVIGLGVWVGHLAAKPPDRSRLLGRCLAAVAGLFLISPTQFPWYFTWLVPLLALQPFIPLLLYTALLPLYYLKYLFWGRIDSAPLAVGLALAQHAPVWAAIAWYYLRRPRWSTAAAVVN